MECGERRSMRAMRLNGGGRGGGEGGERGDGEHRSACMSLLPQHTSDNTPTVPWIPPLHAGPRIHPWSFDYAAERYLENGTAASTNSCALRGSCRSIASVTRRTPLAAPSKSLPSWRRCRHVARSASISCFRVGNEGRWRRTKCVDEQHGTRARMRTERGKAMESGQSQCL